MSNLKGVYFNGKLLTLPGAYSSVESSMTSPKTENGAKMIAIIGECTGGEPGVVQFFNEPSAAKRVLKSGALLKACQKAWNPVSKTKEGVGLGGANTIAVIRSNVATKGNSTIKQSAAVEASIKDVMKVVHDGFTGGITVSGAFTGKTNKTIKIVITSAGTSALTNAKYNWCYANEDTFRLGTDASLPTTATEIAEGVKVLFAAGNYVVGDTFFIPCTAAVTTSDELFTVTSKDWGDAANNIQHKVTDGTTTGTKKFTVYNTRDDVYEIFDNLGQVMSIKYTGTQPYATMSIISDGNGNAIRLQTYIGTDAENAIVDLDIDLKDAGYKTLNSLYRILSSYENYTIVSHDDFNTELSVNDLDFVDKASIKNTCEITAVLADLKKQVDARSQFCEITLKNREMGTLESYAFVGLYGGSAGTSPTSWTDYFDMLSRYDVSYIVPLTDDMSIIAECDEHVRYMSGNMGKERRMICGGGTAVPMETAIGNAKRLSDDRCQYVYPGFYDLNENNELTLYPAYILAAQHAGRAAYLPDGESATHDHYKMSAVEKELEVDEITKLLNAGVVTFELVTSGDSYGTASVRLVQDITTYTSNTDPLFCERAVGITADALNKDIRANLEELLVGKRTTTATLTTARNRILSILQNRVKQEVILAYNEVSVYKEDGIVWVEYEVAPAEPTNFVLIKSHFYSQDVAADGVE